MNKIKKIQQDIANYKLENKSNNFADFIATFYKDKTVEICVSLEFERITTEQTSTPVYTTIYGTVLDSMNGFLILDCVAKKENTLIKGNVVFINQSEIVGLQPYSNECSLVDIFLKHGSKVFNILKGSS